LLLESDALNLFVHEALTRSETGGLTVSDCFSAYVTFCNERCWNALTRRKFGDDISAAVTRGFGLLQRHDVRGSTGKGQRGWNGLRVRENCMGTTGEHASDVSDARFPDTSDTSFPLQSEKVSEVEQAPLGALPYVGEDEKGTLADMVSQSDLL